MKELQLIFDLLASHPRGVLASLVKVEGSSYRRVGARLFWRPEGPRLGSISGGCLEEDLIERAQRVQASGESDLVIYDTTSENDLVWGVGLGCHGIVHVLLERVSEFPRPLQIVQQAWRARQGAVLGLAFGATPSARGPLFALSAGGAEWSHLQIAPELCRAEVARALASRHSHYTELPSAQGNLPVFWEYLPPPLRLCIFGAGDDAQPLVRLAKELGWEVTIADPRSAYATRERFPQADDVRVLPAESAAALPWDPLCIAVIMTHHYRFDLPLLRTVVTFPLPYIGLLGPKKRADKILDELAKEGVEISSEQRRRLHAPVGLDLGGGSPEEVALAIVAEVQAVMSGREARPLRDRTRPIHG